MHNKVDYLPLEALGGRIAATTALVYPPGIGLVLPGERYGEVNSPLLTYLHMVEEACNLFPGFEVEIQGIYREVEEDGRIRLFSYVLQE